MEPVNEKKEALARAKKLLGQDDDYVLMYATLELRRCLEAVVYEKLWAYRSRIPAKVAQKWQPPQAFRALLAVEPDASQSSMIRFAPEETLGGPTSGPFRTLGTDLRPKPGWLSKTYNKLGSMLHAHWPYAARARLDDPVKIREYLNLVAAELDPYVVTTFTSTFATTVQFDCVACGQKIIANTAGIEKNGEAFCLDVDCGARYFAFKEGEQFGFRLDGPDVECPDCGENIQIPTVKIAAQFRFNCDKCGTRLEICPPIWDFRKTQETSASDSD